MAMGVHGRASAGVAVVIALIAVGPDASLAGSTPAAGVKRGSGAKLVTFFRPTGDTLVQKGTGPIRVIVHLRPGARLTKVDVDRVDVTRLLTRGPGGYWGAIVNVDRHLHYGFNDAFATATGRDGSRATAHVRFIVAQRDDSLLRLTRFRVQTSAAPLQVALRETTGTNVRAALSVAQGVSVRAYVNDRRVDRAFSYVGGRLVVRLGAAEGLRFGRNLVQLLVHKTHPYKRQSSFDIESRTVYIARNAPIASAGADHTITQGGLVHFDGLATKLPPGFARPSFRWRIASAPRGSKAKLRNASSSRPTLVPDKPGRYDVRVSVRGTPRRPSGGLGARDASDTGTSNDTATVTVMPDIPPAGVSLDTLNENYNISLGGDLVIPGSEGCNPDTPVACTQLHYLVLDRRTLQRTAVGTVQASVAGIDKLGTILDGYSGSLDQLVVLNWVGVVGGSELEADRAALSNLLQKIGAPTLTAAQRELIKHDDAGLPYSPGSAVGVVGAPAGSAFVRLGHFPACSRPCVLQNRGGMSGYLRLNGVTGKYDFVFTDPVGFDTETNQTPTDFSPSQLTIKVGDKAYTQPNPGGGVSGFHVLLLYPDSLAPLVARVITTNAADGAERPADVRELADQLTRAADNSARPLVILQAFGAPHGNDGPWDQVAQQVERLGGTRQVFDAMNTTDPRGLNGEDSKRKGPYAFVGRVGSTAPVAEASHSLDGVPGRLRGVLMRGRDDGYDPMAAGPALSDGQSPVNTELIQIANQAPRPFPPFKDANGQPVGEAQAQAVQKFLGGPDVTRLCSVTAPVCNIRESYYQSYDAPWSSIQVDLTNAEVGCSEPREGFTVAQCQGIRAQLLKEVSMVAEVQQYFGPLGLQQPFGATGVAALANVTEIAQQINDAVQPPPVDNTTSTNLSMIGQILFPTPTTPYPGAFSALSAAFSLAGYFTKQDGSPNLIGPQVTTAASKLGVELADRYQQAGDNFDDLGRLMVSDYGKLTVVASKVNAKPGPGEFDWRLGNVGRLRDALTRAAKETIYERLLPLAYPYMYKLGGWANARDWWCWVPWPYRDRYLFRKQVDRAQFVGRYPGTSTVAVAKASYTDSGGDAYVPGIPDSIADPLFKPVAEDGLGLNKLQFYSPRNGFRYVSLDQLRGASGIAPYCAEVPDPPGNGH
jgi:hypothetical protein